MANKFNDLSLVRDTVKDNMVSLVSMINYLDSTLSLFYINDDLLQLLEIERASLGEEFNFYAYIYVDDRHNVKMRLNNLKLGEELAVEYRLRTLDGATFWVLHFSQIINYNGNKLLISKITNISKLRTEYDELVLKAYNDPLTKIYNREFLHVSVTNYLQINNNSCSLAMIDVDNFKYINDTRGHRCGDDVLIAIANTIRKIISSGYYGRLGGDEFVIFYKDVFDEESAFKKGLILKNAINETIKEMKLDKYLSVSVGIVFEKNAVIYENMLSRADIALNNAKSLGKNKVALYNNSFTLNELEKTRSTNVSPILYTMMGNQALDILNILANAPSIELSIKGVVEYIGNRYPLDRILIIEKSLDLRHASIVIEWQRDERQLMDRKEFTDKPLEEWSMSKFNSDGFAYYENLNAVEEPHKSFMTQLGISSYLDVEIKEANEVIGYIYFDVFDESIKLNDYEIKTLVYNAKLLSETLRHRRNKLVFKHNSEQLIQVFNEISVDGLVIVDKISEQIMYVNDHFKSAYSQMQLGTHYLTLINEENEFYIPFKKFYEDVKQTRFAMGDVIVKKFEMNYGSYVNVLLVFNQKQ